jgi:hypothetical protein
LEIEGQRPVGIELVLVAHSECEPFDGFGLNHPPSTMYIVIDQKPSAGGVSPFAKDTVY